MEINIIAVQVREIRLRELLAHMKEWLLWYKSVIPELQRLGQEDCKPKANQTLWKAPGSQRQCVTEAVMLWQ